MLSIWELPNNRICLFSQRVKVGNSLGILCLLLSCSFLSRGSSELFVSICLPAGFSVLPQHFTLQTPVHVKIKCATNICAKMAFYFDMHQGFVFCWFESTLLRPSGASIVDVTPARIRRCWACGAFAVFTKRSVECRYISAILQLNDFQLLLVGFVMLGLNLVSPGIQPLELKFGLGPVIFLNLAN